MRTSLKRPLRRTDRVTFAGSRTRSVLHPFAACLKELRPAARTRRPPMAGSSHAYGPGSVFSDAPPPESLSCPCRAIHLVPPGKADRTGSAPVPQGHFRACPAGLGTARTLPGLFDKLWGRPAHCRTPPLFPVRCMVFPKNCPLTSTYVRYIIIVHQFEFEGRTPGGTAG